MPVPRNHTAMAYDAKSKAYILFGGHDGTNVMGDNGYSRIINGIKKEKLLL
jgi:hypothetical protein